ncbi:MAG: stage II sporulation protein R [Lachnospiraceae bacterium]|nr:stage II sporulation protein R [Lachnospiraceae bacterium]
MNLGRGAILGILLGVLGGTFLAVLDVSADYKERKSEQEELSDHVIRFHVRANSDEEEDQLLKEEVKANLVAYVSPLLEQCSTKEESKMVLEDEMEELEKIALETIHEEGYDYTVSIYFSTEDFPMKEYGDILIPSGEYESLRVDIGEAAGQNWWCLIYPPLCFVDGSTVIVDEDGKEVLKEEVGEEAYQNMLIEEEPKVVVKFKLYEELKELFGF